MALLIGLVTWSCEEESNLEPEGNWELSAPTLTQPNSDNKIILDENTPFSNVEFKWDAAKSSAGYGVYYDVLIDSLNAEDPNHPILSLPANNGGKSNDVTITVSELNQALYMAGYKPGEDIQVQWSVKASCLSKTVLNTAPLTVVRYDDDHLYLCGSATETGNNISNAIWMKRLKNAQGDKLNLYESYTQLKANEDFMVYNGRSENAIAYGLNDEGELVRGGQAIRVDSEGIYRISIDFDAMSISFFKIDRLALIGDALTGAWESDEALNYKGMGVWQADINFVKTGSYIIRANNDWQGLIKEVDASNHEVILEDFGTAYGYTFDNFQQEEAGYYTVTLTMTANKYTLDLEKAPEQRIYIITNNTDVYEMTMIGDGLFATTSYIALQTSDQILINTQDDGNGISYSILGAMEQGDADKVEGTISLEESNLFFSPAIDQAYGFVVDIKTGELKWHYYNLKLFHWDNDAEGGWDAKSETKLSYTHPYTFSSTADLQANFESKIFSPWEIQFGAGSSDNSTALTGTVTNDSGASNLSNITTSGSYNITLTVAPDFSTANYTFTAQ